MLFLDWPKVVRQFRAAACEQPAATKRLLLAQAKAWELTLQDTSQYLVDRGLIDALGEDAGTTAYAILKPLSVPRPNG